MPRINLPVLLLSFTVALVAWFFVYGQNLQDGVNYTLKLGPKNVVGLNPSHWKIVSVDPITMHLQAPFAEIDAINKEHLDNLLPQVKIHLDDLSAASGKTSCEIDYGKLGKFVISPIRTVVDLERIIHKSVPVIVDAKGRLNDSELSIQGIIPVLRKVSVIGPESEVKLVKEAHGFLDLVSINLGKIESQDVILSATGEDGQAYSDVVVNPATVGARPTIVATPSEKEVLVTPNIVGAPAVGFSAYDLNVNPTTVKLRGNFVSLSNTSRVWTEPINVDGLNASKMFKARLKIPIDLTCEGKQVVTVRYMIQADKSSTPPVPNPAGSPQVPIGATAGAATGGGTP